MSEFPEEFEQFIGLTDPTNIHEAYAEWHEMKIEELEKQAEQREAKHVDAPAEGLNIRWDWILAVAAGVLIGIYIADMLRGAP